MHKMYVSSATKQLPCLFKNPFLLDDGDDENFCLRAKKKSILSGVFPNGFMPRVVVTKIRGGIVMHDTPIVFFFFIDVGWWWC